MNTLLTLDEVQVWQQEGSINIDAQRFAQHCEEDSFHWCTRVWLAHSQSNICSCVPACNPLIDH